MRFLIGLLALAAAAGSEPSLPQALAEIQAQDLQGAASILEQITRREPANDIAWRGLGFAYLKLHRPDEAIVAYGRAHQIDPNLPTPLYNLGLAYALKGDRNQSFAWLRKAHDTRRFDMSQMETAPELAPLKEDPRFTALLPTRKDFDSPFVEPVKVLREWDGEATNGQFGWIARNIGDVDGDGVPDIVTSAPTLNHNAGRVYVYSTRTGKLLWKADGAVGDQLGSGVEGAGDTNRDGIPDVIASSPVGGYARVYSGQDGRILLTLKAEDAAKDQFGQHVSGVGDVNHDGFADVIVGAPGHNEGRAYVYSGRDGHLLVALYGERVGDGFGNAVSRLYPPESRVASNRRADSRIHENRPGLCLYRPVGSADIHHRIRQNRLRPWEHVPFCSWRFEWRRSARCLCVRLAKQRPWAGDRPYLCSFGERRAPPIGTNREVFGRRIRNQSVDCRRRGRGRTRRPDRGGLAVRSKRDQRRARISLLGKRRCLAEDLHFQDTGRYLRLRCREHGRYRWRRDRGFADHCRMEWSEWVPFRTRVPDFIRD